MLVHINDLSLLKDSIDLSKNNSIFRSSIKNLVTVDFTHYGYYEKSQLWEEKYSLNS